MAVELAPETIERLRSMEPREALAAAQDALYATGSAGSEDFQDLYRQLVDEGVLNWDQIPGFD